MRRTEKSGLSRLRSPYKGQYERGSNSYTTEKMYNKDGILSSEKYIHPDTLDRRALQKRIMALVAKGISKADIVDILNNEYPNSNLKQYFERYVDNYMPMPKNTSKKEIEDEER